MPKPRRTIRPTYLNLAIPEDIRAMLDLHLYSTVERRVPHGAYSAYITNLIRADIQSHAKGGSDAICNG